MGCHFLRSGVGAGGPSAGFVGSTWAVSAAGVGVGIFCVDGMDDLGCHFLRSTEDVGGRVVGRIAAADSGSMAIGEELVDMAGTGSAAGAAGTGFVSTG